MICDDDFYEGKCPARTEDGRCVSKYPCSNKVEPPKPMTNAERIRAMNDEEMAEFVSSIPMCVGKDEDKNCEEDGCKDCFLKWLQQPSEDDGHDA